MKKLAGIVGAGALAAGILGGVLIATPDSPEPVGIQPVAETEDVASALSCDTVRELDRSASQARGVIPGPEQWPPTSRGSSAMLRDPSLRSTRIPGNRRAVPRR